MLDEADLAAGWRVWSAEEEKLVLAYRPDVFDGSEFPPPCLPTIYVTRGRRTRRPGPNRSGPDASWWVTLFLEPEVDDGGEAFPTREAATAGAHDLAARFAAGEIDYRGLYQVPRPDYFEKLDELAQGERAGGTVE